MNYRITIHINNGKKMTILTQHDGDKESLCDQLCENVAKNKICYLANDTDHSIILKSADVSAIEVITLGESEKIETDDKFSITNKVSSPKVTKISKPNKDEKIKNPVDIEDLIGGEEIEEIDDEQPNDDDDETEISSETLSTDDDTDEDILSQVKEWHKEVGEEQ